MKGYSFPLTKVLDFVGVCVEVLQHSQPIRVMLCSVSLPLYPEQASKWLTSTCAHSFFLESAEGRE